MENSIENPQPKKPRPRDQPEIRQLGIFVVVLVSLHVIYLITATHPSLDNGIMILGLTLPSVAVFGSIMGSVVFVYYLNLMKKIKQWKKLQN